MIEKRQARDKHKLGKPFSKERPLSQVIYAPKNPGVQFNGGTDIYSIGNLYLLTGAGWLLASIPDVAGIFNDTVVDALPHGTCVKRRVFESDF